MVLCITIAGSSLVQSELRKSIQHCTILTGSNGDVTVVGIDAAHPGVAQLDYPAIRGQEGKIDAIGPASLPTNLILGNDERDLREAS